ncbi:Uncharacterised protein [uncultured archaeon]|nr:Uncharacterised protein [uncultured archaeon]
MSKIILLVSITIFLSMSNVSTIHIFDSTANSSPQQVNIIAPSTSTFNIDEISNNLNNGDFGVWINTKYNGVSNSTKLDIDLTQFTLMLSSLEWKYFNINFEQQGDTRVGIQFSKTQIYVFGETDPYVNVLQTQFDFTTTCETDKEVKISLEVRFPFSLINKGSISESYQLDSPQSIISQKLAKLSLTLNEKTHSKLFKIISEKLINIHITTDENNVDTQPVLTNSESYFCIRTGFSSPEGEKLPGKVLTRFFSGRNKLIDPQVLRMNIAPDIDGKSSLTFFNSYLTVDESGNEAFYRTFSIGFEPAAELQITSILRESKIRYDFGRSADVSTMISLQALGGSLSGIVQHFIIDPLPEYMSFDLTVLGERSFKYEADRQYSVTYSVDSIQDDNLIKLDLKNLPLTMTVEWGLGISLLAKTGSGLIDLNMSNDIDEVSLSLSGSTTPFIRVTNFPKRIRLEGFIDVPNFNGYIRASKVSDATTTISVPIKFDKWLITGNLEMYNGYGQVSFNLPGNDNSQVSVGLDTGNNAFLGLDFTVVDTQTSNQVLYVSVDSIATDNFLLSFNNSGGEIKDFKMSGMITELSNIRIKINYQGLNFEVSGTWVLRQEGSFSIEASKTIDFTLDNINAGDFIINGNLLVNPGGYVKVEWQRGETGYFIFSTHGIATEVEVAFGDKYSSNVYFYGKVALASGATVKFSWDWSSNGYFMVFSNLFKELDVEAYINYSPEQQQYQYGFKANATNVMFTRTLKWDIQNLRFWWLGDEPLPSQWDVWILWDYVWHEVV